ncbi:MAG: hypothetical protein L0228_10240 [Planctomycetes bacterium]|nr:hypothetical protein [Planctomycetota bacterium]
MAAGCRLLNDEANLHGRSPLQPARPSPDSVKMEIIWARFPAGDPALNDEAWQDIDEAQLDPAVHRELANNGLRAGIIISKLPDAIARALNRRGLAGHHRRDGRAESAEQNVPVPLSENGYGIRSNQLLADPIVRGRVRQMPRNQRYEITASDVYDSMPLLICGQRELGGHTFQQAQGIYAMRVDPQPDRTTLVELTPELHHGAPRIRWTGGDEGVWHQAPLRDREVFDRLRISARLAPGDMLIVMSLPDAGSRLGHYFHTVDSADGPQQKLILIRLAEVPPSDAFANL